MILVTDQITMIIYMSEFRKGTKIKDRYTLKELQGSGNFGEVWLAHDEILDSDVAIKVYISLDSRGVEEFKSEYTTTQELRHPNLLTPTYFDVWQHRPFLVMKYCAKGSSSKYVAKMDEYRLWQFIRDVSAGLGYLHTQAEPIVHQDIKPDNILVDDNDRYLITDFGISKKIRSTMRKQSKRAVGAGATAYMGPERFDADPSPIKASDIWSLGASIYELATGELPFSGLGGGMQRNGAEVPSLDIKWSKDMNMVMQSCLAKETWNRPTAKQLEAYSNAILQGQPAKATWFTSGYSTEEDPQEEGSGDDQNVKEKNPKSKKIWIIGSVLFIVIACVVGYIYCSGGGNGSGERKPIVAPDDSVAICMDSLPSEKSEIGKEGEKPTEIEEREKPTPSENKQERQEINKSNSSPISSKGEKAEKSVDADNNATILANALAEGDYRKVQKLANQGYAAAYGPLARYYLANHDYETAEVYARKAVNAGFSEGEAVLKNLEKLGYYD